MLNKFHRWANRNMPTREGMERNRYIKPFAHRVLRSELWRFNRRSVPRGVALGMLAGIIIPIGQILAAAVLAMPIRANVPVAALTTFVTNPVTTPLLWIVAYNFGSWILRVDGMTYGAPISNAVHSSQIGEWMEWITGKVGVTAFGLVVVAVIAASISYLIASLGWRMWIAHKWNLRKRRRAYAHPTVTS